MRALIGPITDPAIQALIFKASLANPLMCTTSVLLAPLEKKSHWFGEYINKEEEKKGIYLEIA